MQPVVRSALRGRGNSTFRGWLALKPIQTMTLKTLILWALISTPISVAVILLLEL
jgi:hypothetical protein